MHRLLLFFILLGIQCLVSAQESPNPFDLSSSTSIQEEKLIPETAAKNLDQLSKENPFDLKSKTTESPEEEPLDSSRPSLKSNPFDLESEIIEEPIEEIISAVDQPLTEKTSDLPEDTSGKSSGWILSLTMIILALATFIFIFFRSLYTKVYKAIFNDNQLSLLFRERTGGTSGHFFITYTLFFLSTGLFICLALIHFNLLEEDNLFKQYSLITSALAGLFILKHLVLALIGYVFPISKEIKLYSFSIMIFSIIIGIIMPFADLILAYSTENIKTFIIYFVSIIVASFYLLRTLRGVFIANRFIFDFSFHFLLYLCAVEIAPALVLYKVIIDLNS